MNLRTELLETLTGVYDSIGGMQDATGRFRHPDAGYSIYGQYAGYYFALLYTFEREGNPYYLDENTLARAVKGWDYYATQITEAGLANIITFNDQYWGDVLDEWGLYYWINTVELLKPFLPAAKTAEWSERIDVAAAAAGDVIERTSSSAAYLESLRENSVQNHFVWTVLCYYRYGMVRGDRAIMDRAETEMERILSFRHEAGLWLEERTPVVKYAEVTACAVSLFEMYSSNAKASEAVEHNLQYVLATLYPDFTKNECMDGRNRYARGITHYTAPTFYKSDAGKAYLTRWVRYIREQGDVDKDLKGVTVLADMARMMPEEAERSEEDVWRYVPESTRYEGLKAVIERKRDWVVTMCGLEQKTLNNRWFLERQNLVSVFDRASGLLVGGGHSIAQPELSTFAVVSAGTLYYLPQEGALEPEGLGIRAVYGGRICTVRATAMTEQETKLVYRVEGLLETERAYVQIPFFVGGGGGSINVQGADVPLDSEPQCRFVPSNAAFVFKNVEYRLTSDAEFRYPILPYNSYKQAQRRQFGEAFGALKVELDDRSNEVELTLRRRA